MLTTRNCVFLLDAEGYLTVPALEELLLLTCETWLTLTVLPFEWDKISADCVSPHSEPE